MAPVRLAAGAIFALSGAASWLLPDPWTPPPQTCNTDFNENPTCAPESEGASPPPLPASPPPGSGATTCAAGLDGCTVVQVAATSSPSASTRSSTANSAASPSTEGPAQPRYRRGAPPTTPSDPGNDSGGSGNESDSWLYVPGLEMGAVVSLVMVRTVLRAHRRSSPRGWLPHGQQRHAPRTLRVLRCLDLHSPPRWESGLVRLPLYISVDERRGLRPRRRKPLPRHPIGAAPSHRGSGLRRTCGRKCADEIWTIANPMTSSFVMRAPTPGSDTARSKGGRIARVSSARTTRC